MLSFILMIIIVFLLFGLIVLFFNKCYIPFINCYELWCKAIAKHLLKKKEVPYIYIWKWVITFMSWLWIFLVLYIMILIKIEQKIFYFIFLLVFPLLIILFGTFSSELSKIMGSKYNEERKRHKIIRFFKDRYLPKYIYDRIIKPMFGNTFLDFSIYITIIYLLISILIINDDGSLPNFLFFIYICILPVSLIIFIYLRNVDELERNFRRYLAYFILLLFVFTDAYEKFYVLIGSKNLNEGKDIIIYIFLAVFTALDNLIQPIHKEYKIYKNEQIKCKSST